MYIALREVLEKRRDAPLADHGVIVSVVSWILLVAMLIFLGARMLMKQVLRKKEQRLFGLDDVFLFAAVLFSIGQTAAVSMEAIHALGQHVDDLNANQKRIFQTTEYASCILYIANMGCARISVCILIKNMLPGRPPRIAAWAFGIFSAIWTVIGVLVAAFTCSVPEPWNFLGDKCIDIVAFANYICVTNIVVEVLLVAIPLSVWNLRLSAGRSICISSLFMARLTIVIAIAVELHFANSYATSPDYTYDHWQTVLCVQIAQNLSVISACLPCLCPFILNILSGETKLMPVRKEYKPNAPACRIGRHLKGWCPETFDPMSSDTSELPLKEKTDDEYCKPLATWGLDKGSVHLQTQSNRLPANGKNVATTVQELKPPQDIFMRRVSTPMSMRTDSVRRPGTSHSHSKELPPVPAIPKSLAQVGVLPSSGWDADSNDSTQGNDSPNLNSIFSERGRSDSPSSLRHRDSEYIFKRSNVISVPEDHAFFEQEYWKKYPPPPLSPPVIRDGREMRFPR